MHSCLAWPRVSSAEVSRELRLQCVNRMETRVLRGIIQFQHTTWARKTCLTPSLRPEVPIVTGVQKICVCQRNVDNPKLTWRGRSLPSHRVVGALLSTLPDRLLRCGGTIVQQCAPLSLQRRLS